MQSLLVAAALLEIVAWLCTSVIQDANGSMCIVTRPNNNMIIKLISHLKNNIERKLSLTFQNKESALGTNACTTTMIHHFHAIFDTEL